MPAANPKKAMSVSSMQCGDTAAMTLQFQLIGSRITEITENKADLVSGKSRFPPDSYKKVRCFDI